LITRSAAVQEALERLIARGPPAGSGISADTLARCAVFDRHVLALDITGIGDASSSPLAHNCYLIGVLICDFHAGELIFDSLIQDG
jgi:hypothetical protein